MGSLWSVSKLENGMRRIRFQNNLSDHSLENREGTITNPRWRLLRHLINFGITQTFPLLLLFFCQPHSWNLGLEYLCLRPLHRGKLSPSLWMHIPGYASGLEDQCFCVQVWRSVFSIVHGVLVGKGGCQGWRAGLESDSGRLLIKGCRLVETIALSSWHWETLHFKATWTFWSFP